MNFDGAEVHHLSEQSIYITPLHILEMRRKMKELKMQFKADIEFIENLEKEGLLKCYIERQLKINK